jgi:hypothetical protein
MARNASRIKLGYYPLPAAEGARLRRLLDFAPGASAVDPGAGTGAALHQLTAGAEVEKHAVELDAERATVAAASGIATVHGNLFDTVGRAESFSFLYLNPPYDSEIASMGNKRMEYLFLEHTFRWLVESGVLLMVVPQERLEPAIPADPPYSGRRRDFRPCFRWLEEKGIYPQTMIFLTDLWGTFPDDAPTYPVIWASTGSRQVPFGEVIPMEAA